VLDEAGLALAEDGSAGWGPSILPLAEERFEAGIGGLGLGLGPVVGRREVKDLIGRR
jgi:hypothetical protein